MNYKLMIINPGSTSTKIAVFEGNNAVFEHTIRHSTEEIEKFDSIYQQLEFRRSLILQTLSEKGIDLKIFDAVIGRGGMLRPLESGTYKVNDKMLEDLKIGIQGQHASNLGGVIAKDIADSIGKEAFIVDPIVVDEMDEVARISGLPQIQRKSVLHALNQKAVGRRYAIENSKRYDELNLVIAHMGGGISVGAHRKGRVIDVNNGLDGEGPFSPERSGGLPNGDLVTMCFSGKYKESEIRHFINGKGGLIAHLGTNDMIKIEKEIANGNEKCKLIHDALAYQVSKEIGKYAAVLSGDVDVIILTGGLAYSQSLVNYISNKVSFISKVVVYPGEGEMQALAEGGLRVLSGEEKAKEY